MTALPRLAIVSRSLGTFDGISIMLDDCLPKGTYVARTISSSRKDYLGRFRDGMIPAWAEVVDLGEDDFAAVEAGLLPDECAEVPFG